MGFELRELATAHRAPEQLLLLSVSLLRRTRVEMSIMPTGMLEGAFILGFFSVTIGP